MKKIVLNAITISIIFGLWSVKSFAESTTVEIRSYKGYMSHDQAVASVMGFIFGNIKYDTYYYDSIEMERVLRTHSKAECNGTATLVTDGRSIAVDTYMVGVSCEKLNLPPVR